MRLWLIWVVLLVIVLAVVVLGLIVRAKSPPRTSSRFKAKVFMTPNELEFLGRLEAAVPELRFHCQVSMGALLDPATARRENARAHLSARGMFSQKIVDFVAQHKSTGQVVAVIELDDRTHNSERDESRDAMLRQANYRVIRWQSKKKPDGGAIRDALIDLKPELTDSRIEPVVAPH